MTYKSKTSIFILARGDDGDSIERLVVEDHANVDERDDNGLTALHICATYGSTNACAKLLRLGADFSIQDFESGWTPLHRSFYFGHLKISLLLINAGASVSDHVGDNTWKTDVQPKRERERFIRNSSQWKANIDHEGMSPLDLLSVSLFRELQTSKSSLQSTSVLSFGKADFTLGVPLPNSTSDVLRPRRIDALAGHRIIQVIASKHHSLALTKEGEVYSWGHGRGGRLGLGDEVTQPVPRLLMSFSGTMIRMLCAAENHSMAVSVSGDLYSWGSNRFGQLGHGGGDALKAYFSPKKVENLKKRIVVAIAAGDTHSVCFTSTGELFVWGSNKHGQLGIPNSELTSSPGGTGCGSAVPKQVYLRGSKGTRSNFLAKTHFKNPILQIAAARFSTLVLCRPEDRGDGNSRISVANEVYQWGHGSSVPTRVQFSRRTGQINLPSASLSGKTPVKGEGSGKTSVNNSGVSDERIERDTLLERFFGNRPIAPVTIIQITAGTYHNAALSSQGHVYTWGLGSDQLGHGPNENRLSSPQLLEALLPENGGGRAVLVSAACNRTCVVSDVGDLYTWGATTSQGVLGHGAGSYQPVPKLVGGVKRVVGVAGGEDHTIVLTAAYVPDLPFTDALSAVSIDRVKRFTPSQPNDCALVIAGADNLTGKKAMIKQNNTSLSMQARSKNTAMAAVDDAAEEDSDTAGEDEEDDIDGITDDIEDNSPFLFNEQDRSAADARSEMGELSSNENFDDDSLSDYRASHCSPCVMASEGASSEKKMAIASSSQPALRILSLQELCQRKIAESVDTRNCIAVLASAEAIHATALSSYCTNFIRCNLDAVLVQSRPADLEALTEDLNLAGPVSSISGRRSSIDRTSVRPTSGSISDSSSLHRPTSGSFSGSSLFAPETDALLSQSARKRSGSRDFETLQSVTKAVRSVKKKLQSIEDLESKLKDQTLLQLNEEQLEKVSRRQALQSELKRLNLLHARLEGEERIKEQARLLREKTAANPSVNMDRLSTANPPTNVKTPSTTNNEANKTIAPTTDHRTQIQKTQDVSLSSESLTESLLSATIHQTPVKQPVSSCSASTTSLVATDTSIAKTASGSKGKKAKFISMTDFQLKSQTAAKASPANNPTVTQNTSNSAASLVPSFDDWTKAVCSGETSTLTESATSSGGRTVGSVKIWGGVCTTANTTTAPTKSLKDIVEEQAAAALAASQTTAAAGPESPKWSISSAGSGGRTVLSPPPALPSPSLRSSPRPAAESPLHTSAVQFPAADVRRGPSSKFSPTVVASVSAKSSSGSGGLSLLEFLTPRKNKDNKLASTLPGDLSSTQVSAPAASPCPWASPTAPAPSTQTATSEKKPKSLLEIQSEEEVTRLMSNMSTLKGNDNPWFQERRKRADSMEEVIRSQREEKMRQEEEERKNKEEKEAKARAKKEAKERRLKQCCKQKQNQAVKTRDSGEDGNSPSTKKPNKKGKSAIIQKAETLPSIQDATASHQSSNGSSGDAQPAQSRPFEKKIQNDGVSKTDSPCAGNGVESVGASVTTTQAAVNVEAKRSRHQSSVKRDHSQHKSPQPLNHREHNSITSHEKSH